MTLIVLAFLFGLLIGSFLNVCIYRWPRDLSVVRPRSHCPECERPIAWYDNVPLVSFFLVRGRCRHCGAAIPWRYPAVELLTGFLFATAAWQHGPTLPALKLCCFSALLVGLVFTDLEALILPDELTKGGLVLGLLFALLVPFDFGVGHVLLFSRLPLPLLSLIDAAAAAALAGGLLLALREAYFRLRHREGLGLGDIKLVAMIAAFYGFRGFAMATLFGSLAGSVIGLAYIWLRGKEAATYELPYGTFLGVAALVVAFVGSPVLF